MSEGPTTVGSIKGKVDIDIAEALAKLEEVKAAARTIGGRNSTIKVDTKDAVRETENLERATKKMGSGFNNAAKEQNNLQATAIAALVAISAAMPPVAAGAVAATGALTGMGVAGALGIAGIARAMKTGQGEGVKFTGMVKTLQENVHALQDSSLKGMLPGFEKSFNILEQHMPTLNSMVHEFGGMLGSMAPTGLDAVLTLLERAMPAFRSGGTLLSHMVTALDGFSHSAAYSGFIKYTVDNMPAVEKFLTSVIKLVGDLLAAWAPLGAVTLPLLTNLVNVLDDVINATGPIVPAIVFMVAAFKGLAPVIGVVKSLAVAMDLLGASSGAAAGKVAAVGAAAGGAGGGGGLMGLAAGAALPVAGALAVAGFLGTAGNMAATQFGVTGSAGKSAKDAARLMGQTTGTAAAGSGVASVAGNPMRGMMNSTLGSAFTSAAGGTGYVDTQTAKNLTALDATFATMVKSGNIKQASSMVKDFAAANHLSSAQVAQALPEYTSQVATFKQTASAAQLAKAGMMGTAAANQALATSAQQVAGAQLTAKDAMAGMSAAAKQNGTSLSESSAKGRANREAMLSAASGISSYGAALVASGQSADQAQSAMAPLIGSLADQAVKAGFSKSQVVSLIATYMHLPKSVVTKLLAQDEATKKAQQAKKFADEYAKGHYQAILKGDYTPAEKAAAAAAAAGHKYASGYYKAILQADGYPAKNAAAIAKQEAHNYAAGQYIAQLRANGAPASTIIAAIRSQMAALNGLTSTVYLKAVATGVSLNQSAVINRQYQQHGKTGGTAGSSSFGTMNAMRGLAGGGTTNFDGTVSGPGSASSDAAGLYRLANGEEVISNLFGQADRWRPLLKAINSNKLDGSFLDRMTKAVRPSVTVRTVQPEVHIHNPVAVDPVAQAAEAAHLALAMAGIG